MKNAKQDTFWLAQAAKRISENFTDSQTEIIVSSGASPSGIYHMGHLREVLTADALAWALRRSGRKARHIHFVDDFDAFRKVPSNIDPSFEQYLGMPLYLTPSPEGEGSYADYFFNAFKRSLDTLGVEMEVVRSHKAYLSGTFTSVIEHTLQNIDKVRETIEQVSGRQLAKDWAPVQLLSDKSSLREWSYSSIDTTTQEVVYVDALGGEGRLSYSNGRVKLDWRVDWPARWSIWGVNVEPFGRDHATKGGSYDTGKVLVERLFTATAPLPYPYEFINLKGETKKMSASSGTGILPAELLAMAPAPALKHFIINSRPSLQLFFDKSLGFGRFIDSYAELEKTGDDNGITPLAASRVGESERTTTDIPFSHLTTAWQSALGDIEKAKAILRRSEYSDLVDAQSVQIDIMFGHIAHWIEAWAPEELVFTIQEDVPELALSDKQTAFLQSLSDRISSNDEQQDGEWYHVQIHEVREQLGLSPKEAFEAIYGVILGKSSGPKAGWFLATLDRQWLIDRLSRS